MTGTLQGQKAGTFLTTPLGSLGRELRWIRRKKSGLKSYTGPDDDAVKGSGGNLRTPASHYLGVPVKTRHGTRGTDGEADECR